nr:unnamed protein product [Callosobruchus analis]
MTFKIEVSQSAIFKKLRKLSPSRPYIVNKRITFDIRYYSVAVEQVHDSGTISAPAIFYIEPEDLREKLMAGVDNVQLFACLLVIQRLL